MRWRFGRGREGRAVAKRAGEIGVAFEDMVKVVDWSNYMLPDVV